MYKMNHAAGMRYTVKVSVYNDDDVQLYTYNCTHNENL